MRIVKKVLKTLLVLCILLGISTFLFMQRKTFGKHPSGNRLERIQKSSHYREGTFQNLSSTEVTLKSASMIKMMRDYFNKPKETTPSIPLPSVKTNLATLADEKPVIVWFGHSSYLIQYHGFRILIDPVFSGYASPISYFGKSFPGSDAYSVRDFSNIDAIILTHDHYDHMDYETIVQLAPHVKTFFTGLGVGSHLEHWGIETSKIKEFDWWESHAIQDTIQLISTPARHFSGRGLIRNKTLWTSFVVKLADYKIYIGGDSGYDTHFKKIGEQYGPFDIVMLEAGQYGKDWPYIHMFPEETVQAAQDLKAKLLLPVHWAKFALAYHVWNEPIREVVQKAKEESVPVTTPKIGEPVTLGDKYPASHWWEL